MFFDRKSERQDELGILLEIAKIQNRLLEEGSKEPSFDLTKKQEEMTALLRKRGTPIGIYWWNLPWNRVYEALQKEMGTCKSFEKDGWEWEVSFGHRIDQAGCVIYVKEHGRKSGKARVEHDYQTYETSKYTKKEQIQMVEEYNKKIDERELFSAAISKGPVYSPLTNKSYASMSDYLLSTEHYLVRDNNSDNYARSLYTEHHIHNMKIRTTTQHCYRYYAIGELRVNEERKMDTLCPIKFQIIMEHGDVKTKCDSGIQDKDAFLLALNYIAEERLPYVVPKEYFHNKMKDKSSNYTEAMTLAKMVVCIAKML